MVIKEGKKLRKQTNISAEHRYKERSVFKLINKKKKNVSIFWRLIICESRPLSEGEKRESYSYDLIRTR